MPLKPFDSFTIAPEKHERLWKNAIIVFDSSALLDMYFYSFKTKQVVIDEIFNKLDERLWIPHQVNYEFLKNRSKVILKPVGSYKVLEGELKETVNDIYKKYQTGIRELKSKTKKDDKHPVLDQNLFQELDDINQQHESALKALGEKIKEAIKDQTLEIERTAENDILLAAIDKFFDVGDEQSFSRQMALVEEGKKRYEFQIPPGYEDGTGKDKKTGTQIFGDLFIWKDIIEQAKITKKPIVFICNDLKADWCKKNEDTPTYVEYPRHELIKEIWDEAGVEFWMYSNPQLLYFAQKYLQSEITADQIKEVNAVAKQREISNEDGLSCVFTWPVDETTGIPGEFALEKSLMFLIGHQYNPLKVDWGDGSPLEIVSSKQAVYHKYPAAGQYTVRIYGSLFWFCAMGIGPGRGIQFPAVSELSIPNGMHLHRLQSVSGHLTTLDLSTMPDLVQLLVGNNLLTSLDVKRSEKLMLLYCDNNQLTELDLSGNLFLERLLCCENKITQLDLSKNNIIERLNCRGNLLVKIDLTNNNNLVELNCGNNRLNKEALNDIFEKLPNVNQGKLCITGNPGADTCDRKIALAKGWKFEHNPNYLPELGS